MANTCFTEVVITGPQAEMDALLKELKSAIPDNAGADGRWMGNLWIRLGHGKDDIMAGKYGRCPCEIDAIHPYAPGEIVIHASCAWQPHLKAVRDFTRKYAPSAAIEYIGIESMADLYWSSKPGDDMVYLNAEGDLDEGSMFLEDWDSMIQKDTLLGKMAEKLGMPSSAGYDAIKSAFEAKFPVTLQEFEYVPLDDVCD